MVVILDTNIIIQKPEMNSDIHKVLYNYLEKTESFLLMPDVVYRELPVVYEKRIMRDYEKYLTAIRQLNQLLVNNKTAEYKIDVNEQVKVFMDNIDLVYKRFRNEYRIGHDISMLEETVRRAIYKIRPCSEEREEFRDTLVWLTVINSALLQNEKNIVFISNNTKDYCKQNGELHEHLENDIKEKNIQVAFYPSLENFIQNYAVKIDSIDQKTVEEIASQVDTEEKLKEIFSERCDHHYYKILERKYDNVDDIYITDQEILISDYHIYEIKDNTYLLVVNYAATIYIEAKVKPDYFYSFDSDSYDRKKIISKDFNMEIKIEYTLNENFDVYDWDIIDIEDQ